MKNLMLILILPGTLFGADMYDNIQVVKSVNNQITLTAKCESIQSKIDSIIGLGKKIENQSVDEVPSINQQKDNLCSTNITSIVPKRILDLHDTTTAYPGPNCWNTSLYTNKIVQYRRSVAPEEMTYWMSSPLCRELKANEKEQPGDIIAIRTGGSDAPVEMHGFVYLTKDFSFSKSGFDTQFHYELVSTEYVYQLFALGEYDEYNPNKECRKVEGIPDFEKCPTYANVYRCISYEQYLNSSSFPSKETYLKFDSKILDYERRLADEVDWKRNFNKEKLKAMTEELNLLENEYIQYTNVHENDSVLWDSIKNRISSFRTQLDLLEREI